MNTSRDSQPQKHLGKKEVFAFGFQLSVLVEPKSSPEPQCFAYKMVTVPPSPPPRAIVRCNETSAVLQKVGNHHSTVMHSFQATSVGGSASELV